MIKTCAYVKEHIPNVRFLIYGNKNAVPEYTKECEDLIDKLNLQDNFSLAGFHNNPSKLYLEGDISILTSISEGFPFTVIESMSCGIPIVATDVGGVSEAIVDGESGFICKPKDHQDIGKRVVQLLQDEDLRNQIGINARQKVLESFTIDKFFKYYSAGLLQLFPILIQVVAIIYFNYSLWTYLDFNRYQSTAVVLGVILGFILSAGFVQVIGRQSFFYWQHKKYTQASHIIYSFLKLSVKGILLALVVLAADKRQKVLTVGQIETFNTSFIKLYRRHLLVFFITSIISVVHCFYGIDNTISKKVF